MRTLPEGIPPTGQIAFVVRDLERALEQWSRLSIGPWNIWTFGPERLLQMTYHGRQQPYSMKIALCSIGPLTYELIEAVQGPNIYEEFLQQYGEGVHHLGYYVDDMSAATAASVWTETEPSRTSTHNAIWAAFLRPSWCQSGCSNQNGRCSDRFRMQQSARDNQAVGTKAGEPSQSFSALAALKARLFLLHIRSINRVVKSSSPMSVE